MWLDPTTYKDYDKLPSILKEIQDIFNNNSLEDFRKIGEPWPGVNAFSIFLTHVSMKNNKSEILQSPIEKLSKLSGLHQAFINVIGPNVSLPYHKDDKDLGDIKAPTHCYEIVLAIKIPSTDPDIVGFKVGEEIRSYDSGAIVAFNGQVLHGGWNNSNDYRITVCIDVDKSSNFWA